MGEPPLQHHLPRPLPALRPFFLTPLYSSSSWFCFNSTRHLYNTLQPRGDDWTLSAAYLDVPGAFHPASRPNRATDPTSTRLTSTSLDLSCNTESSRFTVTQRRQ